jgi:hypothetical protein
VPVAALLRRAGLTPEVIADPEERLSVRSQVALLDEAAIALKDDRLGFTLARDFDPRELGLLYYVMASSQYAFIQALDRKDAEPDASSRRLLERIPLILKRSLHGGKS